MHQDRRSSGSAPFRPQRSAKQSYLEFENSILALLLRGLSFAYPIFAFIGCEACFGLWSHSTGPVIFNVVLSEVVPELMWQRQVVNALVGGAATDHSPAQVLQ